MLQTLLNFFKKKKPQQESVETSKPKPVSTQKTSANKTRVRTTKKATATNKSTKPQNKTRRPSNKNNKK